MNLKVYIVPGLWVAAIRGVFLEAGYDLARRIEDADLVVWTGGADINPALYGEKEVPGAGVYLSAERDKYEVAAFKSLPKTGGPLKVGICRGAQLLCVLSGGSLWQDVEGHGQEHLVLDKFTGEKIVVSSMHHQEMIPPAGAKIWAVAAESNRKVKAMNGIITRRSFQDNEYEDIEAIYIPHTESFCFQPHPEIGPDSCTRYFFNLIDKALLAKSGTKAKADVRYDVEVSGITDRMTPKEVLVE